MKKVTTSEAIGMTLCHDLTRIIPGGMKGAQFLRGHVVTEDDLPMLRSMGKEHLYVWDADAGLIHEDDAARFIAARCTGPHIALGDTVREGKIEVRATVDGVLSTDLDALCRLNSIDDVTIAAKRTHTALRAGDAVANLRVTPLAVPPALLDAVAAAAPQTPLFTVTPFCVKTAAVLVTGSEVASGIIPDGFTPVLTEKLAALGIQVTVNRLVGDAAGDICAAISEARHSVDLVLCTGGMSVDPDDNTPEAIRQSGAAIVTYGTPVFPGAMLMLGYFAEGTPILGLPGCVMHAKRTVFDMVLPRIAAGIRLTKRDFAVLGDGGIGF